MDQVPNPDAVVHPLEKPLPYVIMSNGRRFYNWVIGLTPLQDVRKDESVIQ